MKIKKGGYVRYIGYGGIDLTHGAEYLVNRVYDDGTGCIRVLDDVDEGHDLEPDEWEPVKKEPDWIAVHHNGDRCPRGGVWAGLTIEDVETKWYVFRELSTEYPSHRDCLQFVNHVEHGHRPLDATRAAYMLLRFAEEEEKL
jgi:hypothetical protein